MRRSILLTGALLLVACSDRGGFGLPQATVDSPAEPASPVATSPPPALLARVETPGGRFEPATLELEQGRPTVLELSNPDDRTHTLLVNELSVFLEARPGETVRLPFTPAEAGTFAMYCSVPGHRAAGEEGTVVVVPG